MKNLEEQVEKQDKQKQKDLEKILERLSNYSIVDQLEILANIFIATGAPRLGNDFPDVVGPENLTVALADYKSTHGETLGTALIQQGLVLLVWIDSINE